MFGFKSKHFQDEVLNHWIASADDFSLPPSEFYKALQEQLDLIKVPGLETSQVEYAEGGLLSAKRIYLRLIRERLAFDICAAPFGTRFIFSCRTVYSPVVLRFWHVLLALLFWCAVYYGLIRFLGWFLGLIALLGILLTVSMMLRNVVAEGLHDVDAVLIKIPALGPIYERFFRKETYYRLDTRLMYLDTIPNEVQKLAAEVTAAKGVKLIRQYRIAPLLGELYKPLLPPAVELVLPPTAEVKV